jgi:hypothetical protein
MMEDNLFGCKINLPIIESKSGDNYTVARLRSDGN